MAQHGRNSGKEKSNSKGIWIVYAAITKLCKVRSPAFLPSKPEGIALTEYGNPKLSEKPPAVGSLDELTVSAAIVG
ncbi:MAG: hypothetical protein Kow00121_58150 [Elainellaceae cyanobacterium]